MFFLLTLGSLTHLSFFLTLNKVQPWPTSPCSYITSIDRSYDRNHLKYLVRKFWYELSKPHPQKKNLSSSKLVIWYMVLFFLFLFSLSKSILMFHLEHQRLSLTLIEFFSFPCYRSVVTVVGVYELLSSWFLSFYPWIPFYFSFDQFDDCVFLLSVKLDDFAWIWNLGFMGL